MGDMEAPNDSRRLLRQRLLLLLTKAGRCRAGLAFLSGLLLGWLLIGWWLWPVQWIDCSPWELQPAYQQRYIALVAAELGRTGNVTQARNNVAGWEATSLADLLATMEQQSATPELRQQVAALRRALGAPAPEPPAPVPFARKAMLGSAVLAALFQLAAVALATVPGLIGRSREAARAEAYEMAPDGLPDSAQEAQEIWLEALEESREQAEDIASLPSSEQQTTEGGEGTGAGSRPPKVTATVPGTDVKAPNLTSPTDLSSNTAHLQAIDLPGVEETQQLLSELAASTENTNPSREALVQIIEHIDAADLVLQAQEVLDRLQGLPRLLPDPFGIGELPQMGGNRS